MPPPMKAQTEKKKSRVVLKGRVISGEDMLIKLREKEKALEEKKERQEERKRKRESKAEEKGNKQKEKLRRKEERVKITKSKQAKQKEQKIVRKKRVTTDEDRPQSERQSRLASSIYTCGVCSVRGRVDDEAQGIEWVGCDEDMCLAWYHFECLSNGEKEFVRESLSEGSDWFCKECKPWLYTEE